MPASSLLYSEYVGLLVYASEKWLSNYKVILKFTELIINIDILMKADHLLSCSCAQQRIVLLPDMLNILIQFHIEVEENISDNFDECLAVNDFFFFIKGW